MAENLYYLQISLRALHKLPPPRKLLIFEIERSTHTLLTQQTRSFKYNLWMRKKISFQEWHLHKSVAYLYRDGVQHAYSKIRHSLRSKYPVNLVRSRRVDTKLHDGGRKGSCVHYTYLRITTGVNSDFCVILILHYRIRSTLNLILNEKNLEEHKKKIWSSWFDAHKNFSCL